MKKLRAINLGGWFVLERWMDEELFASNNVEGNDETCFSKQVTDFQEKLNKHQLNLLFLIFQYSFQEQT